jgi:hypothetical protein
MLMDAIKGYIQIASGLGDATSEKAREVAQGLLSVVGIANPNDVASQVSGMAEEVLGVAKAQRENLVSLVRAEVTTVVDSSGLAKTADLDALKSRLAKVADDVERLLDQMPGAAARHDAARFVEEHTPAAITAASMRARGRPAKKSPAAAPAAAAESAKAPSVKKAAATRKAASTRKTAATKKTAAKASTAKKTTATKRATPARKAPAKTAKKAPAASANG